MTRLAIVELQAAVLVSRVSAQRGGHIVCSNLEATKVRKDAIPRECTHTCQSICPRYTTISNRPGHTTVIPRAAACLNSCTHLRRIGLGAILTACVCTTNCNLRTIRSAPLAGLARFLNSLASWLSDWLVWITCSEIWFREDIVTCVVVKAGICGIRHASYKVQTITCLWVVGWNNAGSAKSWILKLALLRPIAVLHTGIRIYICKACAFYTYANVTACWTVPFAFTRPCICALFERFGCGTGYRRKGCHNTASWARELTSLIGDIIQACYWVETGILRAGRCSCGCLANKVGCIIHAGRSRKILAIGDWIKILRWVHRVSTRDFTQSISVNRTACHLSDIKNTSALGGNNCHAWILAHHVIARLIRDIRNRSTACIWRIEPAVKSTIASLCFHYTGFPIQTWSVARKVCLSDCDAAKGSRVITARLASFGYAHTGDSIKFNSHAGIGGAGAAWINLGWHTGSTVEHAGCRSNA